MHISLYTLFVDIINDSLYTLFVDIINDSLYTFYVWILLTTASIRLQDNFWIQY